MNILISGMAENQGGTEKFIVSQLSRNSDPESQFYLLNDMRCLHLAYEDQFSNLGVKKVFALSVSEKKHPLKFYLEVKRICQENVIDVLILNVNTARVRHLLELFASKAAGVPIRVVHSHTASCDNFKAIINRFICWPFIKTDFMHLVSKRLACGKEAGVWEFGKKPFKVIRNGIDTRLFEFQLETRDKIRERLKINYSAKVFIHVGRISKPKNTTFLVNLFCEYHRNHPNDILLIVGGVDTVRDEYERVVKALDLIGNPLYIKLLGARNDIPALLCASDVFMLPSLYEGFPIVAIEAQCSGLPCVMSTNITKDSDLNKISQFVDLAEPISSWINAMEKAVEYGSRFDRSNGKLMTTSYSLDTTAKEYWTVIKSLAE